MLGFRNMKIGTRLGVGFGALIALLVLVAGVGIGRVEAIRTDTDLILHDRYEKVSLTHAIENAVNLQARELRTALITTDVDLVRSELATVEAADGRIAAALDKLQPALRSAEDKAALASLVRTRAAYMQDKAEIARLVASQSLDEGGTYLLQHLVPSQAAYLSALARLTDSQVAQMQAFGKEATDVATSARLLMLALAAGAVALGVGVSIGTTRSITRPLSHAVQLARLVARGDLTSPAQAHGSDEAGQLLEALHQMNGSLADIVRQVRNSSDSIAVGSTQIAGGNADLSHRTEEQASNLQQTVSAMAQMMGTVRQTAASAQLAAQLAGEASAVATRGGTMVERVAQTMGQISGSSKKISEITGVIDGIAFQTNILALNAAVEAARAGEQGRGFAVVAGEVRTLAQRAASAAREIRTLIAASVDHVDAGCSLADDAGKTMGDIVSRVCRVSQLIAEIDTATRDQSASMGRIGHAVSHLDAMTQRNAALVEESAAAAESLNRQSTQLAHAVGTFMLA